MKEATTYMEGHAIDQLRIDTDSLLFSVRGARADADVLERVLSYFDRENVVVNILTQTAPVDGRTEYGFIISDRHKAQAQYLKTALEGCECLINEHIVRLSLTGIGMRTQSGIAARFLDVFAREDIPVLMITTSEIRIAAVVESESAARAVAALRTVFEL